MPTFAADPARALTDLSTTAGKAEISHGGVLYVQYCARCHGNVGSGGGVLPDLGRSPAGIQNNFASIVREGLLTANGMPNFGSRLSEQDVADLHGYILTVANEKAKKEKK